MTHLTEYTAVRRNDTLDSAHRAVGIVCKIHCRFAVKVNILSSNLTVFDELCDNLIACYKTSFAVRDRYVVNLAHLAVHKPRRLVGANLSKSKL